MRRFKAPGNLREPRHPEGAGRDADVVRGAMLHHIPRERCLRNLSTRYNQQFDYVIKTVYKPGRALLNSSAHGR